MIRDNKKRPIYLDNHATTPVDPAVLDAMLPYFGEKFGNPHSGTHFYGWEAREAVELAREQVAELIGAAPDEVYFTSGATESNNLAIKGIGRMYRGRKDHMVSCVSEHMCVLDSLFNMEREGASVTYLDVGADGLIDLDALADAITDATILVSIMTVQNEIGIIQPMAEIGALCRERGVFLHTDAAQATGKITIDVKAMNIDILSLTAHKYYGPMGIGALYVGRKPKVRLEPLFSGGGQENNMRSGTLPAPLCVALGKASELGLAALENEPARLGEMRDHLLGRLQVALPGIHINGSMAHRVPGNLNVSFEGVRAEDIMAAVPDVAVSSGSACSSASDESSFVLRAIGLSNDLAESSLRFGLGRFTTAEEVDYAADRLIAEISRLRQEKQDAGIPTRILDEVK
ncbi:MAG: aminotransferase class V-fold PLP-dependent enzyme [Rhodospirillaceae bacterium]|jgi:cysteine desulfurase|nr:aminotransferase class V-fold PLP-dependent enzyme [Rhodospirillaceae bacterium]MBT4674678.1 aminotransferase class V-fold PLP-dependent enzyme [Rhodospirillaceae bacterium]MBT5839000.1 aminotransferase class V-fold PLP-dependent enzyme [Rhodospirillaceae bacterium]MBT6292968.1 aminotransferase class V-fold PLP-dependent enzyme [Rhodospirillaceae bacterium]MBT6860027.1 aminotransferase class V-fold PLP-dependent enzyme [Rhodospirillaceae bacterium]